MINNSRTVKTLLHQFVIIILFACASNSSAALVSYSYTGNSFSTVPFGSSNLLLGANISGSFTLVSALAPNLVQASILDEVLAFSFTEGELVVTELSTLDSIKLEIGTDGEGNIDAWSMRFENSSLSHVISSSNMTDFASLMTSEGYTTGTNIFNPGVWNVTTVPAPAAIWLFASGVLGLGVAARSRKM